MAMAELLDSVENSVWHAFDFLALEGNGTVTKSKLKVVVPPVFQCSCGEPSIMYY